MVGNNSAAWQKEMFEEHGIILRLVKALENYSNKLANDKETKKEALEDILFLITNFAEKCHHGKEEDVLFPELEKKPLKDSNSVGFLIIEHEQARGFVKTMKKAAKKELIANANSYVKLLRSHIAKETELFNEANLLLSQKEKDNIWQGFEIIEKTVIGEGKHKEYLEKLAIIETSQT
jgi:hemerythrin-like domain-containing protein